MPSLYTRLQPHPGHLTIFSPLIFLTSKHLKQINSEKNTQKKEFAEEIAISFLVQARPRAQILISAFFSSKERIVDTLISLKRKRTKEAIKKIITFIHVSVLLLCWRDFVSSIIIASFHSMVGLLIIKIIKTIYRLFP